MPYTTFHIPGLQTQADAEAVMFELQDLPCVAQADVNLAQQIAWVSHTTMIAADDIAAALAEAGYEATVQGAG
jgi:copper chaperone CopZ